MARKLNLLGKVVVIAVVALIVAGGYFGGKFIYNHVPSDLLTGFSIIGAEDNVDDTVNILEDSIVNKTYGKIFGILSSDITKSVTESDFASKLAAKFGSVTYTLEKVFTEGEKGFAIFSSEKDMVTIPLVKENGTWKVSYFEQEARCSDKCTADRCQDSKVLIKCLDINGDGCYEEAAKTCDIECASSACSTVRSNFVIKMGDMISEFPANVQLFVLNSDGTATLEVGRDIFVFKKGETKTVKGLTITANDITKTSVSLKIVQAK